MNARRRFVFVALTLGILIFAVVVSLFWNSDPDENPNTITGARGKTTAFPVRDLARERKVKPSGPSAKPLVDGIAAKVGAGFAQSALMKGRAMPSAFRMMEYPEGKPKFTGEPAVAFVSVPGSDDHVAIEPNQIGEFPPVYAAPGETVDVCVVFPETKAGTKVRVVAEDGGSFADADGKPAKVMELDAGQSFALPFTLGNIEGTYRLTIATTEGEPKRLHLHAGPAMR